MPKILIADSSKPSIVMTSEVFKDKIPGITIHVAETGRLALEMLAEHEPDLCVVDFDLPDVDGPSLIETIRKNFSGPVLMTAFPDRIVHEAVEENLFTCTDASNWLSKPINVPQMCEVIDKFLKEGHRIGKRFETKLETQLIGKAAGRGKRAPKVDGVVTNISVGGVCVKLKGSLKLKKNQELTMSFSLNDEEIEEAPMAKKGGRKKTVPAAKKGAETKIKAKVCWVAGGEIGVSFGRLSEIQKTGLLDHLKTCEALVDEAN